MNIKPFVTYLKRQSPPPQLASGSTGWLELPNGQRWNPSHSYKFNADVAVFRTACTPSVWPSTSICSLMASI